MRSFRFFALGIVFLLNGCTDKQKNSITEIVREWQNKEVIFPGDMVFTKYGKDVIEYEIPHSSHKILVYVDSIGCTSCKLQLHKWREFIREVDSLDCGTVPVIFVFHPRDLWEISYLLERDSINIPVCIDVDDRLNAINRFPSHQEFQSFLLDDENKVVFIGNPVHNLRLREMYLSEICGGKYQLSAVQLSRNTQIEVGDTEFDLGVILKGGSKTVSVSIKNVGDSPFMIFDTRTSCGCTHIEYEKRQILPDTKTRINITYNADHRGYFNKTVFLYGNMENSPLLIRLKGYIE